jgi:hypothetical protein
MIKPRQFKVHTISRHRIDCHGRGLLRNNRRALRTILWFLDLRWDSLASGQGGCNVQRVLHDLRRFGVNQCEGRRRRIRLDNSVLNSHESRRVAQCARGRVHERCRQHRYAVHGDAQRHGTPGGLRFKGIEHLGEMDSFEEGTKSIEPADSVQCATIHSTRCWGLCCVVHTGQGLHRPRSPFRSVLDFGSTFEVHTHIAQEGMRGRGASHAYGTHEAGRANTMQRHVLTCSASPCCLRMCSLPLPTNENTAT